MLFLEGVIKIEQGQTKFKRVTAKGYPVRQWVLSLPIPLRLLLARYPKQLSKVMQQDTQLSTVLGDSLKQRPDLNFTNFTIMGYGDKNALVYVFGMGSEQLGGETLVYEGGSGDYICSQANFGRLEGITGKILDAMFPLHFGNFAGILVKAVWAWLGLAMALLPISGMMLWLERGVNAKHPAHSARTYELVARLLSGTCTGIVSATAALFPFQLLCNQFMPRKDATTAIFITYFSVWGLSTLFGLAVSARVSFRVLSYATAICMVAVMPMDIVFTGSHLFNVIKTQHYVSVSVDLTLFILGILSLYWLQLKRPQKNTEVTNSQPEMSNP